MIKILTTLLLITTISFAEENNDKTILKFHAEWCEHCKVINENLSELNLKESNINIKSIDIDKDKELVKKYKVHFIPTLIFKVGDKDKDKISGIKSKTELIELIDKNLSVKIINKKDKMNNMNFLDMENKTHKKDEDKMNNMNFLDKVKSSNSHYKYNNLKSSSCNVLKTDSCKIK